MTAASDDEKLIRDLVVGWAADVLVGGGTRLFAHLGDTQPQLQHVETTVSDAAVHLRYRIANR